MVKTAAKTVHAFAPGEVILFGEHSVVYGRMALACSIDRGIRVTLTALEGKLEIHSHLGVLKAHIENEKYCVTQANALLEPLVALIEDCCHAVHAPLAGIQVEIESQLPEQSGLASSAAVSSALAKALQCWTDGKESDEDLVKRIYASEIRIQQRGSIIGSSCTSLGGVIMVEAGQWKRMKAPTFPEIGILDSVERCPTHVSTGIVKQKLDLNKLEVEKHFDAMDALAYEGQEAFRKGQWDKMGKFMTENQRHLQFLGVSTPKIDALLVALSKEIWGGKITGAGGGGCVVVLPKSGRKDTIQKIAEKAGCVYLPAKLSMQGATAS